MSGGHPKKGWTSKAGGDVCTPNATIASVRASGTHVPHSGSLHVEAVMIEVRRLLRLPAVLLNFRKHLPRAWKIALIHGRTNRDFVLSSPALHHQLRSGGIQLRPLPDALYNRTESFFARSGKRWYNALLISREFWTFVSIAPHVLLFEVDSILCPAPTVPIEWWVGRYVIVGAPWHPRWGAGRFWCGSLACCVGNSGLSLWNRAVMADL
ncbi:hypothetical protein EMIHUDRAFT_221111 [Emiliania huxleyi CCMP1516]|uniref:DUF5672 domain-containing protein n=2 Tax=Emiliania huxleyi TaxID=2903 RepID=A0A0D3HZA2_EMIH1|nr:hypothetical protein EMIHUDRAFT_221111 [Emiliania huxleyi CCMP1516]EOD04337.1 hypothetical protein EMIHUDRAFT_221111 [Emiliania huxleyi CCMP1516]|eukprot:XP_005756766.1 hypothetical protein EMIHUDRAFT_221111 [Emiliania huxleyi CCMP1516]